MSEELKIGWDDILEAFYGTVLTDKQVRVWEVFLREKNAKEPEIMAAIKKAATDDLKPVEWRVTVRDVIRWLEMYRTARRIELSAEETAQRRAAFVSEWREKLARGCARDVFLEAASAFAPNSLEYNRLCGEVMTTYSRNNG